MAQSAPDYSMMDEKYLIIVNAIVEDEADINATDKSR